MALNEISLTAGMRNNLFALQKTNNLLQTTQDRLSTGKKVNSALDNPTNFFAAQTHLNRADDLATRKDGMAEAVQTVKAADGGIKAITSLIQAAKGLANTASASSVTTERSTLAAQYTTMLTQIDKLASDSSYRGKNLLNGDNLTVEFSQSQGTASLTVTGFTATSAAAGLNISTVASNWAAVSDATGAATSLDNALSTLRTESSKLAGNLSVITTRQEFTQSMINTLNQGADNLTLADMNEESANMLMLQTRQSLGTTALSLSSQAAQSILRLF